MNTTDLSRLIELFTPADTAASQRISERLTLVLRDPAAYQAQYAEELAERSMEGALPPQEVRDVALIDALLSEDLLWEADAQDPLADTAEGLNDILEQQKRPERLRLATGRGAGGPEQLDALQDALEAQGLALVLLTLDSDAYPLSVVADAQAEELRGLAQELGFGVTVY
ncbi:hypothetical protein E4631_01360 [Hymenobacter sp. UV11]|uniref:DUF6630 family protein n=1 Tax=Hymenobacter sp. UV11 TaxID=1849735 RepID=UPI00105FCDC7|nr:hypothetical protein [Hymenobacter sp. UV11]TDN37546.1 hypothetical protein A8B98_03185 [Hymenobacter sp. UV11]TFZ68741.1 hypothetical protein E4631_01360 [Hymenobacter sp. UV11]